MIFFPWSLKRYSGKNIEINPKFFQLYARIPLNFDPKKEQIKTLTHLSLWIVFIWQFLQEKDDGMERTQHGRVKL